MLKEEWFPRGEGTKVSSKQKLLRNINNHTPDSYGQMIKKDYSISGRTEKATIQNNGNWYYEFSKPGEFTKVTLFTHLDSLRIERELNRTFFNKLNRTHHFRHYSGEPKYWVWAVVYDLSALSLIVFALTGVWLWTLLKKMRVPGLLFMVPGTIILFLTLFFLRLY